MVPDKKLPPQVNDPSYWRARADEARAIAETLSHGPTKRIMLGVASDYERIAQITEARLQEKPSR